MIRPCLALTPTSPPTLAMPLRLATGAEAVLTRVAVRLWTIRGTWPDDTLLGLPHLAWSGPTVPAVEVEAGVRRQIAAVDGVLEVSSVTASWVGAERALTVELIVEGDDGEAVAAVVSDTPEGYAPAAWYLLIETLPIFPGGA